MKISNLFNSGKTVFSFEVFPPKKTSPIESVYGKLEEISALKPDFISVTYSAGGSGSKSRTCEIATKIKEISELNPWHTSPALTAQRLILTATLRF